MLSSEKHALECGGIADGPVGLDLGGRGAEETALGILAEITAVRFGGSGAFMREARKTSIA